MHDLTQEEVDAVSGGGLIEYLARLALEAAVAAAREALDSLSRPQV
jgi:hypothetical protein